MAPKEVLPISRGISRIHSLAALAPLRHPVFRMLWTVTLIANVSMWMSDVAAAWMMTSLTSSPLWVALVQTAATLPVFLLGLPSGALADIADRRRYFIFTQFWIGAVAVLLFFTTLFDAITPALLLVLTFANGVGLVMRWPVYASLVPELVPRQELPAALALSGVAMNVSRIVGPLAAGTLIALANIELVFALNAVLAIVSGAVIIRWKREHVPDPLGREHLLSAMRVGLQFVWQSSHLKSVLMRIWLFFVHATAVLALLPLVARDLSDGNAATFTVLLAAMGAGAISNALLLPRLRMRFNRDQMVMGGTVVQCLAMAGVAVAPTIQLAVPMMFIAGMSWLVTANSLSVSAQLALPDWVRARGMSMVLMGIMGATAMGAAFWGQVASMTSVRASLLLAAVSGVISMLVAHRMLTGRDRDEDLRPSTEFKPPKVKNPPASGHIVTRIEYQVDPNRATDFLALMQESRRSRLRQGAIGWELQADIEKPGCYIEQIVDPSWVDHLRRFERVTAADVALRDRKLAFHLGESTPKVTRYVAVTPERA